MKVALFLLVAVAAAVCTDAQVFTYTAWSACDPGTCTQTRTMTSCQPPGTACGAMALAGNPGAMLTCQSCSIDATTCKPDDLPGLAAQSWQGIYEADPFPVGKCNPAWGAAVGDARCCCVTGKVFVRQFDELVEITFPEGGALAGDGCYITEKASNATSPALNGLTLKPKGISFKTVNPALPGTSGTYVNDAEIASVPGSNVPSVRSAGQVTILGRTYRAILTCGSIYIFGQPGFNGLETDNPFCPQKLNFVAPLADN